jgi:hypothetical protein
MRLLSSARGMTAANGNRAFLLLAGLYVLAVLFILRAYGIPWTVTPYLVYGLKLSVVCALCLLLGRAVYCLVHYRPRHPFPAVWHDWRQVTKERAWLGLPVLLMYPVFIGTFMVLKSAFASLRPFAWDATFMRWDVRLHGGLPARWLVPFMDSPFFTVPIDLVYCEWFLLNAIVLGCMAFTTNRELRRRFWISFVLSWVLLGTLAALVFLSAGPCFYEHVAPGPNPYAEHSSALQQADQRFPVTSIHFQNAMRGGLDGRWYIGGASAMPSMHISMCVLFTLAAWQASRRIGLLLLGITIAMQCACVWLGWHYAVDGYAAALGTWAIWWTVGRFFPCSKKATP